MPFTSKVYGNERNLRIWLPPGYHDPANTQTTYSVLYMFDGAWLFDRCTAPGTQGEWKIDETLTGLIDHHQVEPIIVVGIDSNAHRDVELAPYGNPLFYGAPKIFQGAHVSEFLTDEVLPYVASHYRVKKGREHTGVGGSSLGGLAALTTLLKRPDVFGIGLLESASMQYGMETCCARRYQLSWDQCAFRLVSAPLNSARTRRCWVFPTSTRPSFR